MNRSRQRSVARKLEAPIKTAMQEMVNQYLGMVRKSRLDAFDQLPKEMRDILNEVDERYDIFILKGYATTPFTYRKELIKVRADQYTRHIIDLYEERLSLKNGGSLNNDRATFSPNERDFDG